MIKDDLKQNEGKWRKKEVQRSRAGIFEKSRVEREERLGERMRVRDL